MDYLQLKLNSLFIPNLSQNDAPKLSKSSIDLVTNCRELVNHFILYARPMQLDQLLMKDNKSYQENNRLLKNNKKRYLKN